MKILSAHKHKKKAPRYATVGILSMSSTRREADDISGLWMVKAAQREGHRVLVHQVILDQSSLITRTVLQIIRDHAPQLLLLTGGTGIAAKDVTIEAVQPLLHKELTAFGPIFAQLSFDQIDSAAIMSRATAGIIDQTVLFCLPGSLKACQLACRELIFPEVGHLLAHLKE
jgi:molybdenum cofactor biosynthesis protein B